MNAAKCKELRNDMNAALEAVFKKHGLSGSVGNMTYSDTGITVQKIKLSAPITAGNRKASMKADFVRNASFYGLSADDFGAEFTVRNRTFVVESLNTRRPKNPLGFKCVKTGKSFKGAVSLYTGGI